MGTHKQREKQEDLWIAYTELATAPGHPFYQKLNELLESGGFDNPLSGTEIRTGNLQVHIREFISPISEVLWADEHWLS